MRLQIEPIDLAGLASEARGDDDGAIAIFLGTVRNENAGHRVLFMEYEAYPGMAEKEMERIAAEAGARFVSARIDIVHRVGRLEVGETSVAVIAAAPHRAAAMDACRFTIEALKIRVPIWKREHREGGAVWIGLGS